METIDLIKEVEQKSLLAITEAEKKKNEVILKTQQDAEEKIKKIADDLRFEIEIILKKVEEESKEIKNRELEKRSKLIIDIENSARQNISQAVSFVFNKMIK